MPIKGGGGKPPALPGKGRRSSSKAATPDTDRPSAGRTPAGKKPGKGAGPRAGATKGRRPPETPQAVKAPKATRKSGAAGGVEDGLAPEEVALVEARPKTRDSFDADAQRAEQLLSRMRDTTTTRAALSRIVEE